MCCPEDATSELRSSWSEAAASGRRKKTASPLLYRPCHGSVEDLRLKMESTHRLTGDLEGARPPLLAASLKVHVARRLVLGGGLAVARLRPGHHQARPLPRAAGQVVVRGGVPEVGAGLPAAPDRQASPGGFAQ